MAISIVGTSTSNEADGGSTAASPASHSHTVPSGTDLLLMFVGLDGNDSDEIDTVTWNSNALTLIAESGTPSGDQGDRWMGVYGLLSPSAATGNAEVTLTATNTFFNGYAIGVINIAGTDTASLDAATNVIDQVHDLVGADSVSFSSGGSAGNGLIGCWVIRGANDANTITADTAGFALAFGTDIGTSGISSGGSVANAAYDLDGAPSACAMTWGTVDENSGVYLELVLASGGVAPQAMYHLRYNV